MYISPHAEQIMDRMPRSERTGFLRDCLSMWESSANAVTPKTNAEGQKYWNHWTNYTTATGNQPVP